MLHGFAFGMAIVFFLAAGLFLWIWSGQRANARRFGTESMQATATVTARTTEISSGSSSSGADTGRSIGGVRRHYLVFEFVAAPTGETVESRARVSEEEWDEAKVGDQHTVTYLRGDATVTSLVGGKDWVQGSWLSGVVCAVSGGLGLLCALLAWLTRS